jgi:hypothetical protein
VYIIGGVFVGQKAAWDSLTYSMYYNLQNLIGQNLVDDDQGLLLMSYFDNPDLFELHKMDPNAPVEDVRSILRKFNTHE